MTSKNFFSYQFFNYEVVKNNRIPSLYQFVFHISLLYFSSIDFDSSSLRSGTRYSVNS